MNRPDFMLIGAEKAGTTWLYRNLQGHPELWIPPEKELHFFDNSPRDQARREQTLARARASNRPPKVLGWLEQLAAIQTDRIDDYRNLFKPSGKRLAGDLTTEYAILSDDDVATIARYFPSTRMIFIMRDPIDRLWSAYKMHLKQDEGEIPLQDVGMFKKYLSRLHPGLRTDYRRTLSI